MPRNAARKSRLLVITCAVLGAAALPSTASAGLLVESASGCQAQPLSKPFLPWMDLANYTPAHNGGFEAGSDAWSLDDARVVDGNEPFHVAGDDGTKALKIDSGGTAVTAPMCVGIGHPTMRFFARRTGGLGGLLSSLRLDVIYENHLGLLEQLPIGLILGSTSWQPTAPYLVVANLLPLLPGDETPVAFRFTAQGPADWHIDDVFVDPWRGR